MIIAIRLQPRIGALGLIIANCVSMTIRISYTVYFVFFDRSSAFHLAAGLFSMTFIVAVIARYEASSISSLRHMKGLKKN
jgi:hypothetical protein